jgi:hypothetical protein
MREEHGALPTNLVMLLIFFWSKKENVPWQYQAELGRQDAFQSDREQAGEKQEFVRSDEYILLVWMDASTLKDKFRQVPFEETVLIRKVG